MYWSCDRHVIIMRCTFSNDTVDLNNEPRAAANDSKLDS